MVIKNSADYLDGDLIHMAVMGTENHLLVRDTVVCLTCDNPSHIKNRIEAYKGLVRLAQQKNRNDEVPAEIPLNYESKYNGFVYCFNNDGELVQPIDVREECSPFHFQE